MGHGFRETGSADGRTPLRRLESTMVPTGEARRCSAAFAPDLVALYARPVCAPSALCRAGVSDGRALRSDAIPGSYLLRLGLGAF